MSCATLEHVNYSTPDPAKTAAWMADVFGWKIRWQGPALETGFTMHVGDDARYLALYRPSTDLKPLGDTYSRKGGLNHIGVVVDSLDETEERVINAGFKPISHADYEPGRRLYFYDDAGVEFEVIIYSGGR